jgi:hypothetical protein
VTTCIGQVKVESETAKELGLKPRTQLSPVVEKCALAASAKSSYQEAERDLELMMGLRVGHSSLHRLVQRSQLPVVDARRPVAGVSVDGGKIRLRRKSGGESQWRDYKAVSLHESVCSAYFQDNDALIDWVRHQPRTPMLTCVGDGHDGVWNIIEALAPDGTRRDVLDWFHLVENLFKLDAPAARLERWKSMLWSGLVDEVREELRELKSWEAQRLRAYLRKHRLRIVPYDLFQALGWSIGSGSVESTVKRIAARVKLSGAQWSSSSVSQILHLRCAYLNGVFHVSMTPSA